MADRIPVYEGRIGVADAGSFRPVLPDVADAGAAIARVGQSLLREAEPFVAEDVERQAIREAGVADIVKDEAGNFIRPPMPAGAGTRYAAAYDRVITGRYTEIVSKDFENDLNTLGATHRNDPQAFLAAAQGAAEGRLEGVDESVRGAVEINFAREMSERFRGITQLKAANDWQAGVNGLQATIRTSTEAAVSIYATGAPDAAKRAQIEVDRAIAAAQQLGTMGEFSPAGVDAATRGVLLSVGDAADVAESFTALAALGPKMKSMTDEELARVAMFGSGTTDGGKVAGVDFNGWRELFPSREVSARAGSVAGQALSARIAAANAERTAAAAEAAQQTNEKILAAVKAQNTAPVLGYNQDQVTAIESSYAANGSAFEQMQSAPGRQRTLGFLSEYGMMPTGVKDYIEGQVLGGQVHNVAEFVQNVRMVNAKGAWVGQRIYEQLSPETRATIEYDETMRRAGVPAQNRQSLLEARRRGNFPKMEEVVAAFPRQPGQTYTDQRRRAIAGALGISEQQAAAAVIPGRDFDALLLNNFQLYQGNPAEAVKATARSIANGWTKSDFFVGGVGPKDLVSAGFTAGDLDSATGIMMRRDNPTHATFAAGTARLRPVSDNPASGFGIYVVEYYTPSGRPAGSTYVDMDSAMRGTLARANQRRVDTQRRAASTGSESGWVIKSWVDPVTGKKRVGYRRPDWKPPTK